MTITTVLGRPSGHSNSRGLFNPYSPREKEQAETISTYFRNSLDLPTEDRHYWDPGHRTGTLDEGALWQVAGGMARPRCFQQAELVRVPSIFLGLLIDCSGSMAGNEITRARVLAQAFATALHGHPKCRVSVAGHTERNGRVLLYIVKRAKDPLNLEAFGTLTAQSGNMDAYALQAYGRYIHQDMEDIDTGMIALICDGQPCHSSELMLEAIKQVRHDYRLHTIGIGIGGGMDEDMCTALYGADNYIIAADPVDSLPVLATKLNAFIARIAPD